VKDVVFLYLAQDGTFNTTDATSFGSMLSSSNAGQWQINRISSITSSSLTDALIELECDVASVFTSLNPSSNFYYTAVVTKVILADILTLGPSVSLSALPYSSANGSTSGGVVPIIANVIQMMSGSSISADAAGLSGGTVAKTTTPICRWCNESPCLKLGYTCSSANSGGQRGSSIAPYSEDPTVRGYCRGALANGGGGGNNHNTGGGGGANKCSDSLSWTGDGVSCSLSTRDLSLKVSSFPLLM